MKYESFMLTSTVFSGVLGFSAFVIMIAFLAVGGTLNEFTEMTAQQVPMIVLFLTISIIGFIKYREYKSSISLIESYEILRDDSINKAFALLILIISGLVVWFKWNVLVLNITTLVTAIICVAIPTFYNLITVSSKLKAMRKSDLNSDNTGSNNLNLNVSHISSDGRK